MKALLATAIIYLSTLTTVMASSGVREDNSMTLVYVFLGLCGTIIFLQVVPLLILGFGMLKGVFGKTTKEIKDV